MMPAEYKEGIFNGHVELLQYAERLKDTKRLIPSHIDMLQLISGMYTYIEVARVNMETLDYYVQGKQ
jgi:hypothetical protein